MTETLRQYYENDDVNGDELDGVNVRHQIEQEKHRKNNNNDGDYDNKILLRNNFCSTFSQSRVSNIKL